MARPQKFRLGELLLEQGVITNEQLEAALVEQRARGRKLGRVLVDSGMATEEAIAIAIGRQLGIPYLDLANQQIEPAVAARLSETLARRFRALVIERTDAGVVLGMADPSDVFAYDEIARVLKCELRLAVVAEGQLLAAIDRLYRRTEEISGLARELQRDLGQTQGAIDVEALDASSDDAPVVKLLQSMFEDAAQVKASDIHIEPQEQRLRIRFRIDGEMHLQTEVDSRVGPALALRLKLLAGLDISEKRLPQDGRFNARVKQSSIDVRMSTMPTQYGESVVLRLLVQSAGLLDLGRLGMPAEMLQRYRRMVSRSFGMILVTGPTGSGKTTTLYATLAARNEPNTKIITIEDPVEYRLPGLSQIQVNEKIDLSFSRVLRATLRHDPDIVLVGEMIDSDTAQVGVRAAMTGHLMLSTLHTNNAASTPFRLLDMGVPQFMLASTLLGVIAQRLVRRICPNCRQPHGLDAAERAWLQLELGEDAAPPPVWAGRGCSSCNGSGFAGREAIYEMLEMTPVLVDALNRADLPAFARAAREQLRGRTMRAHAVQRVLAGETTVHEAMRVSAQLDD